MKNHELTYLKKKIEQLKADGVYRELPVNYGPCDNVINLDGKEVINLSSNNYLGLANNEEVEREHAEIFSTVDSVRIEYFGSWTR